MNSHPIDIARPMSTVALLLVLADTIRAEPRPPGVVDVQPARLRDGAGWSHAFRRAFRGGFRRRGKAFGKGRGKATARGQAKGSGVEQVVRVDFSVPEAPLRPVGSAECGGHGVYNPQIDECRCTAGWTGRYCKVRWLRSCNSRTGVDGKPKRGKLNVDAMCAGNCDDERGLCYCAGLASPFQRSLPHFCAPWAHKKSRLPDGRPAYPVRVEGVERTWRMADLIMDKPLPADDSGWRKSWARTFLKPLELLYDEVEGNPVLPVRKAWQTPGARKVPWCSPRLGTAAARTGRPALMCAACYEGWMGPLCEQPKRSYCQRDCNGNGECDSGFCWCRPGWFGVDCSERLLPDAAAPRSAPHETVAAPRLQQLQGLPSPAAESPLRIYVYDMPSEYTTRNLQYRPSPTIGLHRAYVNGNRSKFVAGSLYAMEPALHEWLLDSPLRTSDPKQAHLFWVPIYAASLYMWPIMHFADEPYIGRAQREQKRRSHQGALLMKKALAYIRTTFPFWNATGGRDHVWLMLHDEGPCFCPLEIRPSILLTHYGYYAARPRPWGTYYDDNFLADKAFYARHLGDPARPTQCFSRQKDLVIPPWKVPGFWKDSFKRVSGSEEEARRLRPKLVFFAGDLGLKRLMGCAHDLRQRAYAYA